MPLQSERMNLSSRERAWLPWLGATGKLRMGWSCWLNRATYAIVEKTFDGIAHSRLGFLMHWAEGNWVFLAALTRQIAESRPDACSNCWWNGWLCKRGRI